MWRFLKAVGGVLMYIVFSPLFLLFWFVDNTINGKPEGYDKILGEKLPPGVRYFKGSNTFSIVDVGAYFGNIPESKRRRLQLSQKRLEEARKQNPS
jgi:hypothetical protein